MISKFPKIKIPKTSLKTNRTRSKIHILRIKDGSKLLCARKIIVLFEIVVYLLIFKAH
jgi:hypothetical protein